MMKLRIWKMDRFLNIINECSGCVNLLTEDGELVDLNKNMLIQRNLFRKHREMGNCTDVQVKAAQPQDYFKIVNFYIADTP